MTDKISSYAMMFLSRCCASLIVRVELSTLGKLPFLSNIIIFFRSIMSNPTSKPSMPWDRLIRFRGADGNIHFGEPQIRDAAELTATGLQAKIFSGRSIFSLTKTDDIVDVKEILHLLEPKDVPTVRCIGLNFKAHSMLFIFSLAPI